MELNSEIFIRLINEKLLKKLSVVLKVSVLCCYY